MSEKDKTAEEQLRFEAELAEEISKKQQEEEALALKQEQANEPTGTEKVIASKAGESVAAMHAEKAELQQENADLSNLETDFKEADESGQTAGKMAADTLMHASNPLAAAIVSTGFQDQEDKAEDVALQNPEHENTDNKDNEPMYKSPTPFDTKLKPPGAKD